MFSGWWAHISFGVYLMSPWQNLPVASCELSKEEVINHDWRITHGETSFRWKEDIFDLQKSAGSRKYYFSWNQSRTIINSSSFENQVALLPRFSLVNNNHYTVWLIKEKKTEPNATIFYFQIVHHILKLRELKAQR